MPLQLLGTIASSVQKKVVLYYTSSSTYTPSSYPFNYTAYIVGGAGGRGGNSTMDNGVRQARGYGGGSGSGFYTLVNSATVNSGSISITVGAAGNNGTDYNSANAANNTVSNGNAGGTSSVGNSNAAGGGGGGGTTTSGLLTDGIGGNGGNGGSGGGAGGGTNRNYVNERVNGSDGGAGGYAGGKGGDSTAATPKTGGTGQSGVNNTQGNNANIPSGGFGGGKTDGSFTAYNGITINGTTYGAGRGTGIGWYESTPTGGFVLIVQN